MVNGDDERKQLKAKLDAIKQLLTEFKLERTVNISICAVSAVILLVCGVIVLSKDGNTALFFGLFGGGGGLAFTAHRLLKMWNDAVRILFGDISAVGAGEDQQ